jgi:hypothetical protein
MGTRVFLFLQNPSGWSCGAGSAACEVSPAGNRCAAGVGEFAIFPYSYKNERRLDPGSRDESPVNGMPGRYVK